MARGRPREFDQSVALRAAILVFWEKGFQHTSLEDLTRAMGISRPSLYAAFGDKAALFRAVIDQYAKDRQQDLSSLLKQNPTVAGSIQAILKDSIQRFTDPNLPSGCLLACHASELELEKETRLQLEDMVTQLERALTKHFRKALKRLPATQDHSPTRLANLTVCVLSGLSHAARRGASRRKLEQTAGMFVTAIKSLN